MSGVDHKTSRVEVPLVKRHTMDEVRLQLDQLLLYSDASLGSKSFAGNDSSYIDQLAPIIKSAVVGDHTEELGDMLHAIETAHDAKIKQLCDGPDNPFVNASTALPDIQRRSQAIAETVRVVDKQMAKSSDLLVEKATRHVNMNRTRLNIASALETTRTCLRALEHMNQVHTLLRSKHCVAAVQNLRDLKSMELENLSHLGLGAMISQSMPTLAKLIKESALDSLRIWLAEDHLKDAVNSVGEQAYRLVAKQRQQWSATVADLPHLKAFRFNSPVERAYRQSGRNYLVESRLDIDLSPLYEADLVFDKLDRIPELAHYVGARLEGCADALAAEISDKDSLLKRLQAVTGFCLVDRTISRHLPRIRNAKKVDDTWEKLAQHVSSVLTAEFPHFSTDEHIDFLPIRDTLSAQLEALENFDFNVGSIKVLLRELLAKFSARLLASAEHQFLNKWKQDEYLQMVVKDQTLYDRVMQTVWMNTPPPTGPFPRVFAFSEIYAVTCDILRSIIKHLAGFGDQFQSDPSIVEDTLTTTVDTFLKDVVCKTMAKDLQTASNREQIVQTVINLQYFQVASQSAEKKLDRMRAGTGSASGVKLEATEAFAEAAKSGEARVIMMVEGVVSDFFKDADYDWSALEVQDERSEYILDMTAFLLTLANSTLARLPLDIRSLVYLSAADQISERLFKLLDEAPNGITQPSLQTFREDFEFLSHFISELAANLNNSSLGLQDTEVKQMIDLLTSVNPTEYNVPEIRMKKYDHLRPQKVTSLLAKLEHKNSVASSPRLSTPVSSPRSGQTTFLRYIAGDDKHSS